MKSLERRVAQLEQIGHDDEEPIIIRRWLVKPNMTVELYGDPSRTGVRVPSDTGGGWSIVETGD